MSEFKIIMPKMGESVEEATITKWFVKEGDKVEEEDTLLEIATDKVDSEIPSPVDGVIKKIHFQVDDVVPVGKEIAIIETEDEGGASEEDEKTGEEPEEQKADGGDKEQVEDQEQPSTEKESKEPTSETDDFTKSDRFYSPLVKKIAKEEGISLKELDNLEGTGKEGRVKKEDILAYVEDKKSGKIKTEEPLAAPSAPSAKAPTVAEAPKVTAGVNDSVVEMDRMRKMIAAHMVMSKQVSPHVTSVVEADMTNIVLWRNKVKSEFEKKYGEKITFMPIITSAVARALRDFPQVNSSVDGEKIILRGKVNIGMAVSLPSGNLIVPVIKNADQKNLIGLTADINNLARNARENKLASDDIQGGTFTITNFGSFKNILGTPIINQPQVAILATGSIQKKPVVIETKTGDVIGIRHMMYLSLSYDHRVVDGMLGGMFLRKIADYLEEFNPETVI